MHGFRIKVFFENKVDFKFFCFQPVILKQILIKCLITDRKYRIRFCGKLTLFELFDVF